jgi:Xaa-Pro aminopeptidase
MFESNVYEERRNHLKKHLQSGIVLFLGNDESPINYSANTYPYRQDSSFLYYWGLDRPGLNAIIDIDQNQEIIFADELTIDDIVWMGPQPSLKEQALQVGVAKTLPSEKLDEVIKNAANKSQPLHYLPQYRFDNLLKLTTLLHKDSDEINKAASKALIQAVVDQRSKKSDFEIKEIEYALKISYEMHTTAMKMCKPGRYERTIVGSIEGLAYALGSLTSFPIIFSIHGETLHNHSHNNMMKEGDLVVHDSGAESEQHYASDITRTIPVSGKFSSRQKEIYNLVLEMQEKAIAAIKPGNSYKKVHLLACKILVDGLKQIGLMRGDTEQAVAAGAHALFFPHGLGHMMGLDVHDMEHLGENHVGYNAQTKRSEQFGTNFLRLGKELEPGYVLTVEPGIYFIPTLIDQWKAQKRFSEFINYNQIESYKGFGGIRIEDDVLVLNQGCKILGESIPKNAEKVEEMSAS